MELDMVYRGRSWIVKPGASVQGTSPASSIAQALIGNTVLSGFGPVSYPFMNFMKGFNSMNPIGGSDQTYITALNSDQYPSGTLSSGYYGTLSIPPEYAGGQWVLSWSGDGNVVVGQGAPGFTVISGNAFVSGGTGFNLNVVGVNPRVVFTSAATAPTGWVIQFNPSYAFVGMGNMVLCRIADEAAIAAGQIFTTDFINVIKKLNPKALRNLVWQNINGSNESKPWTYRNQLTAAYYSSNNRIQPSALVSGSGVFTYSAGGDAYSAASYPDMPGSWTEGETFQGIIPVSGANQTTAPTMNVGGRGAIPILTQYTSTLGVGQISGNTSATFVYSAILNSVLWNSGGLSTGPSIECLVNMANAANISLWYQFPGQTIDAEVLPISSYVNTHLSSKLNAYFEYSNEVWNFAGGFQQTFWAQSLGLALGFPNANEEPQFGWYALRVRQIFGNITTNWNYSIGPKLQRVMAFQAAGPSTATQTYRFQGADLNTGLGYTLYNSYVNANYHTAPNRPIDFCDVLAYAVYYSGAQLTNFDANYISLGAGGVTGLLTAADNYALGTPAAIASAFAFVDADVRAGAGGVATLLSYSSTSGPYSPQSIYQVWPSLATGLPVVLYEGSYEGNYPSTGACTIMGISTSYGGSTGTIANLLNGYKNSALFQQLVTDQTNQFLAQSPANSVTAWYELIGPFSSDQWSLLSSAGNNDLYSTPFSSWTALVNINNP